MSGSNDRKLSMESLEDRALMAASVSAGVLTITGTNGNDVVQVLENHETNSVTIIDNGQVTNLSSGAFNEMRVHLNAGNNSFTYRVVGSEFDRDRDFDIWSSDGFDYITLDFRGDNYMNTAIEADVNISINTGSLSDQVAVYLPEIDDADVNITANLGSGNDGMSVIQVGDMVDDANLTANLYGSSGNDNLYYLANYDVDLDSDADLNVNMYGNSGDDSLLFYYRGELDGELRLNQFGQRDEDYLYSNVTLDAGSNGDDWLMQNGGDGVDQVFNYRYDNSSLYSLIRLPSRLSWR